jgi:hypothetical protein
MCQVTRSWVSDSRLASTLTGLNRCQTHGLSSLTIVLTRSLAFRVRQFRERPMARAPVTVI